MTKKAGPAISQALPRYRTRQYRRLQAQANAQNDETVIDLCDLTDNSTSDDETGYLKCGFELQTNLEDSAQDQNIGPSHNAFKEFEAQHLLNAEGYHARFGKEDVDNCLKSSEPVHSQRNHEALMWDYSTYEGSSMAKEMPTYHKKLSFILALDFTCLLSSKYLEEIPSLVEKLAEDPYLSVDELLKLKSLNEIPKLGKILQALKDKVSSMEKEFNERKKKERELQSQADSESSIVQIDEQIARLQAKKAKLAHDLDLKNKEKAQVVAEQDILANSISAVTQEIQTASAEVSTWEMKQKIAETRVAEVLTWYASLKGSFENSG